MSSARLCVRRGQDAHVHGDRAPAPDALDLALLEDAQELRLDRERRVADLVQEHRPAARELELARPRVDARRDALLDAEELALEEALGHRGAVQREERPVAPRGARVQEARGELLARAALPRDEDVDARGRGARDELLGPAHRRRVADEELVDGRRALQRPVLLAEAVEVGRERAEAPAPLERRAPRAPRATRGSAGPPRRTTAASPPRASRSRTTRTPRTRSPETSGTPATLPAGRPKTVSPARASGAFARARSRTNGSDATSSGVGAGSSPTDATAPAPAASSNAAAKPRPGVEDGNGPREDLLEERLLVGGGRERPAHVVERLEAQDLLLERERLEVARGRARGAHGIRRRPDRRARAPTRTSRPASRPGPARASARAGAKRGFFFRIGARASAASSAFPRRPRLCASASRAKYGAG